VTREGRKLTAEDVARRRPVWVAMSDVFLDTETRWGFPWIAQVMVASGLAWEELDAIWRDEIYPECQGNLFQVAGEWALLTLDEPRLIRRAEAGPYRARRLFYRLSAGEIDTQWEAIGRLYRLLLALPETERAAHVEVWTLLAHPYVDRELSTVLFLKEKRDRLAATGWTLERITETFERDFRPVYRTLLLGDDEAVHARNVYEFLAPLAGQEDAPSG
jgi:hypothetical protein